jgi:carboxymethylenebutenolidase
MIENTIDLPTPDGVMATRTFQPGGGKRHPAVIFFMDGVGIRETLLVMARRLASHGYFVALPNLFHRAGPFRPFHGATVFTDPAERERVKALIADVTPPRVAVDTAAVLELLAREPAANAAKIGTVGSCMGGGPALSAAGRFPDRIVAAASYHGGRLATDHPDSPHVVAARARGRLYIAYAENDASFPEDQRQRLEGALTSAGARFTMELYHAAHGFAVPDLPAYNRAAADRHWETLLALFGETLG